MDRFESDKDVTFYTGFPNRSVFKSVFEFWTLEISTDILMTQLLLIIRGAMKMPPRKEDQDN